MPFLSHEHKIGLYVRKPQERVDIRQKPSDASEEELQESILCRNCGSVITSLAEAISVNGNHRHVFTNPEGLVFEIGCFRRADGCLVYGIPTNEFTWFKGYLWCYAHCSVCHIQLGWFYQGSSDGFFGLILDRLIENYTSH